MNFIDQILNLEYYFNYVKMLEDFKVQLISSKLESNIQKVGGMVGSISKREELKLRIFSWPRTKKMVVKYCFVRVKIVGE